MFTSVRFWFGLGLGLALLFLVLVFFGIDLGSMLDALAEINLYLVPPALAFYFLAVLFRTVRWRFLLRSLKPMEVARLYPLVVMGYMANNLLPARLGEVLRAVYLGEKEKVSKAAALGTIAVERVSDGLALILLVAVASLFLPLGGLLRDLGERAGVPWLLLALSVTLPFLAALTFLWLFALPPPWLVRLSARGLLMVPGRLRIPIARLGFFFSRGLSTLKSPPQLGVLLLLSVAVWLAEGAMYLVMGYAFGLDKLLNGWGELLGAMLMVTGLANLAVSVPFIQGGIGLFEGATIAVLVALGVAADEASAYALGLHLLLLLPVTILGLLFVWRENLSLARLTATAPALGDLSAEERRVT